MKQITLAVPLALISAANQLMRAAAYGPDDDQTFTGPTHTDASGAEYALAAGKLDEAALDRMLDVVMPEWGADIGLAKQASAALDWHDSLIRDEGAPTPVFDLSKIVVVEGATMPDAATALGLVRIPPPEPSDENDARIEV